MKAFRLSATGLLCPLGSCDETKKCRSGVTLPNLVQAVEKSLALQKRTLRSQTPVGAMLSSEVRKDKVCNGCKAKFITETALIPHFCSLPYPYRNERTGEV